MISVTGLARRDVAEPVHGNKSTRLLLDGHATAVDVDLETPTPWPGQYYFDLRYAVHPVRSTERTW